MSDILVDIPDENLDKLANLYVKHVDWAPHVLSLIHTTKRWKQSNEFRGQIRFLSPKNSWETDGTIIVIMTFHCYHIFVFTLDDHCTNLHQGLTLTNLLDYENTDVFFCVHEKHMSCVMQLVKNKNLKVRIADSPYYMYAFPPPESGLQVSCPPEVYAKKLDSAIAKEVDSKWPLNFPGSLEYVTDLLEMNGGHGLFLRSTNELVSWVVKHCFGHLGMLQTEEVHKKKGYGMVVTKLLVKEILEEGQRPFATVYAENQTSVRFFEKFGFQKIGTCAFVNIIK